MNIPQFYKDLGVEINKSGNRWTALCPFPGHVDSSPSFVVYSDGSYHCFGCGAHGTVKTIQKAFGLSYRPFPDFDNITDSLDKILFKLKERVEAEVKLETCDSTSKVRFEVYDKIDLLFLEVKKRSKDVGNTKLNLVSLIKRNVSKILSRSKDFS